MLTEANLQWRYLDLDCNLICPWYTLPCLQWLKNQNTKAWNVFEYGAGYSTIWWRANSSNIHSTDHDSNWAKVMGTVFHITKGGYVKELNKIRDCVIIDGEWRMDCVEHAKDFITEGGVMIIDNWGQEDFPQESCDKAEALLQGWSKEVFKQPNHTEWTTAVFQKPK